MKDIFKPQIIIYFSKMEFETFYISIKDGIRKLKKYIKKNISPLTQTVYSTYFRNSTA